MKTVAALNFAQHWQRRLATAPITLYWLFAVAVLLALAVCEPLVSYVDRPIQWRPFPDNPFLGGLCRWDSMWYRTIAKDGYWFREGEQSPVAFFPLYPMLMRAGGWLTDRTLKAGVVVTWLSGMGAVYLFHRWSTLKLPQPSRAVALLLLLTYPFSFFLYGVVYSDALFLMLALASFVFIEEEQPALAGLCAALATATRPVGLALVLGLWLRVLERRGVLAGGLRLDLRKLQLRDAALLLAPLGLVAYSAFLLARFDDPFAFKTAAASWGHTTTVDTWFKVELLKGLTAPDKSTFDKAMLLAHPMLTAAALALVPAARRRFGTAYAVYAAAVVLIPAISSKDFFGMGRYLLAAFPLFAAAGDALAARPRVWRPLVTVSAATLGALAVMFAHWQYIG